ncbi:tetratricopeptide repeat protein [Rapidithrix thailandica]|uniref:Tetratricopeptide repeat protein n=1 Tax=Rapidithrix thailandica TaxID=413964 RepID=A0AAW9S7I0_9BACT
MKKLAAIFVVLLFGVSTGQAQRLPTLDSVKYLLTDMTVQIECTQAVNDLYNFRFTKAELEFLWLKKVYPTHPLPYFLLGLSQWWKIVPNVENTSYDQSFMSYMDSSIYYSESLFDKDDENFEAAFFLAAAYGFKGRLHSERKNWSKAAFAGKKALKYLDYCKGLGQMSPELLFGDGLYNYYSVWIPENYPLLRPIMLFFDKGDKQLGIEQLERVRKEAFYTRVEAQYFLMRIYSIEENQPHKALPIAEYLHSTFPNNAYFERYYARLLYTTGRITKMETVCKDILRKIDQSMAGYEEVSGRYAAFFLGSVYKSRYGDMEAAKKYFDRAVYFAEKIKKLDSGYYLHSLSGLAQIAKRKEDYDLAMEYYEKILENAERKHSTFKEAKEFKKEYKKLKRKKRKNERA